MNTLRILKGKDIVLSVGTHELSFVTEFTAVSEGNSYPVKEMLNEENVDNIILDKKYKISITALSLFDESVFDIEPFELTVSDENKEYVYTGCRVVKVARDIKAVNPIENKFELEAVSMEQREV